MKASLMTFNVLNAWQPNTPVYRTMKDRSRRAAEFILKESPDILCLQEFDYYYRHDGSFVELIADQYAEADTSDELAGDPWNCIFYRKGRFTVVASGGYNFPAGGFVIESTGNADKDSYPPHACNESKYRYPEESPEGAAGIAHSRFRSLGWAVLEDGGGTRALIATTHYSMRSWCHVEEIEFVDTKLAELKERYGCPVIVCGDFNSTTEWGAGKRMLDRAWLDTYDMTAERDDYHSCHPSSGKGTDEKDVAPSGSYKKNAIDHIFTDTEAEVGYYRIYADEELLSVSDHCPTMIDVSIK